MRSSRFFYLLSVAILTITPHFPGRFARAAEEEPLTVSSRPLHQGRINPMLFGNFIVLLDDLVPGMRAEMLSNRGFEDVMS